MERRRWARDHHARGFTLVETLVALAIVTSGVLMLAALALQTTDLVGRARRQAIAALLADAGVAERAAGAIAATAAACLTRDLGGCVEYRDARGAVVPDALAPFAVRWHATPLSAAPLPATVLTVCAVPAVDRAPSTRMVGACVARVVMAP